MKTIELAFLGAIALSAAACAAPASSEEEATAEQSDALMNTGGGSGDPDDCTAARYACYAYCAKSGSSSCYRYCDVVYARCRGLPEPEVQLAPARQLTTTDLAVAAP